MYGEGQRDLGSEVEKWKAMARKHEVQSKANADKARTPALESSGQGSSLVS